MTASQRTEESPLQGLRVLVVEDDYIIATSLYDALTDAGARVHGPAPSVDAALALIDSVESIDAAVLDMNLGSSKVFPVAQALARRGVPFLFATGYDHAYVPPEYSDVPHCEKPVDASMVARMLGPHIAGGSM